MKDFNSLKNQALQTLDSQLSSRLHYHGIAHTLDVLNVCNQYIDRQKLSADDSELLRVGALVHDLGFTVSATDHEEHSMGLAADLMKKYGYKQADIAVVKGLIRSTRVPQSPQTDLEKIICDADLDYLGRQDYYQISELLYKELKSFSKVSDKKEWDHLQVAFLEAHQYHTEFGRAVRQPQKEARLRELKSRIGPGSQNPS